MAYLEKAVPATSRKSDTIPRDTHAADSIIVRGQDAHSLALERVPHIAIVIVVSSKEDSTRDGKGDRGDTAKDIIMAEMVEFPVGTEVEELASRIVGSCCKGFTVGEEPRVRFSKLRTSHAPTVDSVLARPGQILTVQRLCPTRDR